MAFPLAAALGIGAGVSSFAGDIIGGLLGSGSNRQAARASADLQREFAKHGIQWRVEDAKAAKLHPLAALGMMPTHVQPMQLGDPLGPALADAGQNISRSLARVQTEDQAAEADLNRKLLQSQITHNEALTQKVLSDIALDQQARTSAAPGLGIQDLGSSIVGQVLGGNPGAGVVNVTPPPVMTNQPGDPSTMAGINPGSELMQMPFGKMYLPSGKGQESPLELWSEMPAYEKWGWILHNAHRQGKSWLQDYINWSTTGSTWREHKPVLPMDDTEKALQRALQKGLGAARRYGNKTWKDIMSGK